MAIARVVLTYEDDLATPDDGRRDEILDGEMPVSPAPTGIALAPFRELRLAPASLRPSDRS